MPIRFAGCCFWGHFEPAVCLLFAIPIFKLCVYGAAALNRPLDAMYIFENKKRWMRMLHPALFLLACVGPRFALVCAELHRF